MYGNVAGRLVCSFTQNLISVHKNCAAIIMNDFQPETLLGFHVLLCTMNDVHIVHYDNVDVRLRNIGEITWCRIHLQNITE